jgi:hypothetical protein
MKPDQLSYSVGARRFRYSEWYYFGNPGHYQTYILAINDAGPVRADLAHLHEAHGDAGPMTATLVQDTLNLFVGSREGTQFRTSAKPNTYGVVGPMIETDATQWPGADLDVVRVLP